MDDNASKDLGLHIFSAGNAKEILREPNIFIGISLGKPLSKELAEKYLRWSYAHGKKVIVLIADDINAINYINFHGYSEKSAIKKVRKLGDRIDELFQQAATSIQKPATVVRWQDIATSRYSELKSLLTNEFATNTEFKAPILGFVDKYLQQRKSVPENVNKEALAEYIISELPTLLEGIRYGEDDYNVILYPTFKESGMSEFVVKIQKGEFPELKKKLHLKAPTVMIESSLNDKQ